MLSWTTGLPIAGTNGTASMPNNVALALAFKTALRGRSFRGRIFLPGLTEGNVVDNTVQPAFITAWYTFFGILASTLIDLIAWQVVVSRVEGGDPRPAGVVTQVNNWIVTNTVVDSMRRRLPGRGR